MTWTAFPRRTEILRAVVDLARTNREPVDQPTRPVSFAERLKAALAA